MGGGWKSILLFDKYKNYQMAFYWAAGLALVALLAEPAARRPAAGLAAKNAPATAA